MLDFRIETFLTVCQCLNYTRAAELLNITQPAVSQHIRYLEEQYDTRLFRQKGKRMELTESGEMLKQTALSMQHDLIHLKKEIAQEAGKRKKLCFGATLTIGEHMVPERLPYLMKCYPGLSVQLCVANTTELLQKLNQGELEFVIVEGNFPKQEYEYELYKQETFIAVCSSQHVFDRTPDSLERLLTETLVIREEGSGNREIVERILQGRNMSLEDFAGCIEVNDIQSIKELIRCDAGIGFLYRSAVQKELLQGDLREISLSDFQVRHDMAFIWMKDSVFGDYYRECAKLLKPQERKKELLA
ncbi:MAG: LysR family transcriptional regulator [Lachnospiraceae bacterium]|nr:LysR family transcriptional regulator [Lachnospiraceae bacterium]